MPVSSHLYHLLKVLRDNDSPSWVLATVVSKYRSSYRQPGAMMLIDPDGQSLGLVSGGCLEADIRLNARKVLALDQPSCLLYDSMDEGNIAAELGLGCNGRVEVLVQPVRPALRELLLKLLQRMWAGQESYLLHCIESDSSQDLNSVALLNEKNEVVSRSGEAILPVLIESSDHRLIEDQTRRWSVNRHAPPVKLWIFGGGIDARPMVKIAASLGWRVTLVDHRPAYAKQTDFALAETFIRKRPDEFDEEIDADAAILMTHNIQLDADWMAHIKSCTNLRYVGLLGPKDRKQEVLGLADIDSSSEFCARLHGPMGFDIGGDLPESVALSTLAQCHQALFKSEVG